MSCMWAWRAALRGNTRNDYLIVASPFPLSCPLFPFTSLHIVYIVCHSQDCGFGDGGDGVCIPCEEGTFSADADVAPCRRCTLCNLLNRLEETPCSPTSDALCGQCFAGWVINTACGWRQITQICVYVSSLWRRWLCTQVLWTQEHEWGSGAVLFALFLPWHGP